MASFLWLFHNSTYISYFPPAYAECGSRILILGGGGEGGGEWRDLWARICKSLWSPGVDSEESI
jgi:hypothetical protein